MIQSVAFFLVNKLDTPQVRSAETYNFPLNGGNFQTEFHPTALYQHAPNYDQDSTAMLNTAIHKNVNLPWVAATCLAMWFLFIHTPPFWKQRKLLTRDVLLATHIIAAGCIYLACAHNCMFTPSFTVFGKPSKLMHTWVGRIGLIAGIISFSLGAYLAWSRYGLETVGGTTLAFALPITIGGIAQLSAQYYGYIAIRQYKSIAQEVQNKIRHTDENLLTKEHKDDSDHDLNRLRVAQRSALRKHVGNMVSLFVSACGIPAGIRLAELVTGGNDGIATVAAILLVIGVLSWIGIRYMNIMMPDVSSDINASNRNGYGNII
jgi:hypothetical protein